MKKLLVCVPMAIAAMLITMPPMATADVPPVPHHAAPPPPPPPPGRALRPGMMWCVECGGSGTHGRTWYGFRKTCHKCGGTGMLPRPVPPKPPIPPKPHVAPKPHPKPVPAPVPGAGHAPGHPNGGHKGPPRP